ncbi:hypothetical protein ACHAXS_004430 [Conticribra weissflogii]
MDVDYESPSIATESTLNNVQASLQRLDDKLATGMRIVDVAKVRWLTDVEVLQYLDQAAAVGESPPLELAISTEPPTAPPTSGTLLLYRASETPNYGDDGIEWIRGKEGTTWMNMGGVLAGDATLVSPEGSVKSEGNPAIVKGSMESATGDDLSGENSSSAMRQGATVQYLTSVNSPTFHRREYRGPQDIVLMHYLDSVRALRMTSELIDRIIEFSTFAKPKSSVSSTENPPPSSKPDRGKKLDDTMNILYGMVNEDNAKGTSTAEANHDSILESTNMAAFSSLMKHVSPDEAKGIVDAMDSALDDDLLENDVTDLDIDEAINQVLTEDGDGEAGDLTLEGLPEVAVAASRGAASIIEDRILASMEGALTEELRTKLIKTTEVLMNVAGVNLDTGKMDLVRDSDTASGGSSTKTGSSKYETGSPLTEIIDITPNFHVAGYRPRSDNGELIQEHIPSMVISTASPIPDLPPYVDPYSSWVTFVAFVDFMEMSRDPTVRSISFERLTQLTPYSFKCPIPAEIREFSSRHIVVVGVLLPKGALQSRKISMVGIELALKLSIQTEWSAAADIVTTLKHSKVLKDIRPLVSGIRRPLFVVPCGGTRLQLLSQISTMDIKIYPAQDSDRIFSTDVPKKLNVRTSTQARGNSAEPKSSEEKRKRDEYMQEWASVPGNDLSMTSDEVDRHRKIRFVERITNAISDANDGGTHHDVADLDNMNDDELDALLGEVLMRFVEVTIENSTDDDHLRRDIDFCGYSGLALLHHAAFYNFTGLATLLLSHGANPDVVSAAGKLTPLHFAAASGHMESVEILLQSGCNPVPIDADNLTPADHATRAGYSEIARVLDSHIADVGLKQPRNSKSLDALSSTAIDVVLQSAFQELSLKDKLGLNLFATRSKSADDGNVQSESLHGADSKSSVQADMNTDLESGLEHFAFISEEDKVKLRAAMSLANDMDLNEMNRRAGNQDVARFLLRSNYEAVKAASKALDRANKKESDILRSANDADDPSKMQLSRALAMLVLRKNLQSS